MDEQARGLASDHPRDREPQRLGHGPLLAHAAGPQLAGRGDRPARAGRAGLGSPLGAARSRPGGAAVLVRLRPLRRLQLNAGVHFPRETMGPGQGSLARGVRTLVAAALGLLAAGPASAAGTGYSRPAQYGVTLVKDLKVRMSDGVTLAADVYYPTDPATGKLAPGPFPVILAQTPYGKRSVTTRPRSPSANSGGTGASPVPSSQRGYMTAVVDVRGTGSSEGGQLGLFSDRRRRRTAWSSCTGRRGWSMRTGKVGTFGPSYLGMNQIMGTARRSAGRNSPLKAIVPDRRGQSTPTATWPSAAAC